VRTWGNTHRTGYPLLRRSPSSNLGSPEPQRETIASVKAPEPRSTAESTLFRDQGAYWQIAYGAKLIGIRSVRGLFYLQYLLLRPEEKVHVRDLITEGDRYWVSSGRRGKRPADGIELPEGTAFISNDCGDVLDPRAIQEYKSRLSQLRSELDQASRWADLERADSIRREMEFIISQLASAYRLDGLVRKMGDSTDRARKAVANRIHESIARIDKEHPALGRHLKNAIRTGVYCLYAPESKISWKS